MCCGGHFRVVWEESLRRLSELVEDKQWWDFVNFMWCLLCGIPPTTRTKEVINLVPLREFWIWTGKYATWTRPQECTRWHQCLIKINVSDLALIGRVRISSPTPSTSTTSASLYVFTVLAHSVTCTCKEHTNWVLTTHETTYTWKWSFLNCFILFVHKTIFYIEKKTISLRAQANKVSNMLVCALFHTHNT